VIKRFLLALLLAWTAIAPAIASSCAAGCESDAGSMHHSNDRSPTDEAGIPDCHGAENDHDDSNTSQNGAMELACLVASAASLPSSSIAQLEIHFSSEQRASVLLPPLSFQTSAPPRPPQA
jgi:hypothetical protein